MAETNLERHPWTSDPANTPDLQQQIEHAREEHLLLDPRPPEESNQDTLRAMIRTSRVTWAVIVVLLGGLGMAALSWLIQTTQGLGVAGINRTIFWELYIVSLVYFIGIGHAGTFISAAFRVLKFDLRRPIARAAEIVTLFALGAASLFPFIHLGRPWKVYWMLFYPNQRQLWPNPQSPLLWDATAILTYLLGSVLFIYMSLIPDLAMARERTTGWRRALYRALALGWRGTDREWSIQETAANIFAYAIIPIMFSVHTIVSWDFAMSIQPGWHSTIFGPFFIVGALYSGVAAVIIVMAALRSFMKLGYFIRAEHFDGMAKFLLVMTFAWVYFYFNEFLVTWYGDLAAEGAALDMFTSGPLAPLWALMLICNIVIPVAFLWSRRVRRSPWMLFFISVIVQVGMYLERVLIVTGTLGRPELPFNWTTYTPALEIVIAAGAFAFVILFYTLFTRIFPIIPLWEVAEGQMMHGLRKIGRAMTRTKSEPH